MSLKSNRVLRFFLLGYGKAFGAVLKNESSLDNARFSAVMQFSLLLSLKALAIFFLIMHLYCSVFGEVSQLCAERPSYFKVLILCFGGVIIYGVYRLSKIYNGEYDADFPEDHTLKVLVNIYPYFVVLLLIVAISVYIRG